MMKLLLSPTLLAAAFSGLLAIVWAAPARAAQVAPNVVFINAGERGAEVMVRNGGEVPIEVQIRLIFGYEDSDAQGRIRSIYPPDEAHPRSAANWLRAYPQRTVIPPDSRQTIRIFSRAPTDTPEGEYWARVEVQSRPTQIPTEDVEGEQDVQVRVGVTTRQRIPLFVRIGEPRSAVALGGVRARLYENGEDDGTVSRYVRARYRTRLAGNAAFLGTMAARIENGGRLLAEREVPLAIFVPGIRGIRLPLPDAVGAADLEGATLVLEARREHPAIQARNLVAGRTDRWEGPLALE